jgi:hypothetical protein
MRRRYKEHAQKALNENLAPLRRYLLKQIGRPWNKVFSEICQNLRVDSVVQNVDRRTGILRRVTREDRDERQWHLPRCASVGSNQAKLVANPSRESGLDTCGRSCPAWPLRFWPVRRR